MKNEAMENKVFPFFDRPQEDPPVLHSSCAGQECRVYGTELTLPKLTRDVIETPGS
jgi:hypothetical protein